MPEGACGVCTTSVSFSGHSQDGVVLEAVYTGAGWVWGSFERGEVVAKAVCGVFATSAWFSGAGGSVGGEMAPWVGFNLTG